ncbi:WD repeat-containing protein 25, partial [Linum perenne]
PKTMISGVAGVSFLSLTFFSSFSQEKGPLFRQTNKIKKAKMDLLYNTYSNSSDEDGDDELHLRPKPIPEIVPPLCRSQPQPQCPASGHPPVAKRPRLEYIVNPQRDAPVPGRYVSKRERAILSQSSLIPEQPTDVVKHNQDQYSAAEASPVIGSIKDSDFPCDILSNLKRRSDCGNLSKIPERMSIALNSHTKAVNALNWSTNHAHLLASAGMDHTLCIWNVWNRSQKIARIFRFHNAAIKDAKWSPHGFTVLSCGYDCSSRLIDVEKGLQTQIFKEDQAVAVVKFHPQNPSLFLSGGSAGKIRLWDIRSGNVVHEYKRGLGPILDVEFTNNGNQFISSSDVSGGNITENAIIVWDVIREVPLSNQVYVEAFTCPCIRRHPYDPSFVAQSNGDYIAIFSLRPPFKLDKYKRYAKHGVSGFPIKCDFNLDGEKIVSGSSDGSIYFYNYRSSELVRKIKAYDQPCTDVAFHPVMPNVIASCSWDGCISIFE